MIFYVSSFDAIFSFLGLLGAESFCRFTRLMFPFFIPTYEVFIKIHEIENQIILISDFRVVVHCQSIHLILISASWIC